MANMYEIKLDDHQLDVVKGRFYQILLDRQSAMLAALLKEIWPVNEEITNSTLHDVAIEIITKLRQVEHDWSTTSAGEIYARLSALRVEQ